MSEERVRIMGIQVTGGEEPNRVLDCGGEPKVDVARGERS